MDQNHRSVQLGHASFEATRWSVVLEAAQSRLEGGPEALARLCERYWPPLYSFARYRGSDPEDAQDLVQGFFAHLIESRALSAVEQAKGRFRSFLLASFQNFSAMERCRANTEKRGGRAQMIRIDWHNAEGQIPFEPKDPLTPETVRHTQLLREEVAQTLLTANDIDAEVHALCDALVQAEGRVWV
jgi:DNA-directed RNA polymerase specialized sigma24 family protein